MQISTFVVNNEMFALPSFQVEEFFRTMPMTRVFGVDRRIDGLVNIRGRTAVVINMRRCLGIPPRGLNETSEMILLETASGLVAEARDLGLFAYEEPLVLLVDSVSHIHTLDGDEIHPPPANTDKPFVDGVVHTEKHYFTMLSVRKLVDAILEVQSIA